MSQRARVRCGGRAGPLRGGPRRRLGRGRARRDSRAARPVRAGRARRARRARRRARAPRSRARRCRRRGRGRLAVAVRRGGEQRLAYALGGGPRRAPARRAQAAAPVCAGDHAHRWIIARVGARRSARDATDTIDGPDSSGNRLAGLGAECALERVTEQRVLGRERVRGRRRAAAAPSRARARAARHPVGSIATRGSARPLWRTPASSPSPRSCRSISASSKPSPLSASACSRREPRGPNSRQTEGCSPRPMRPRSWCSCEIP